MNYNIFVEKNMHRWGARSLHFEMRNEIVVIANRMCIWLSDAIIEYLDNPTHILYFSDKENWGVVGVSTADKRECPNGYTLHGDKEKKNFAFFNVFADMNNIVMKSIFVGEFGESSEYGKFVLFSKIPTKLRTY